MCIRLTLGLCPNESRIISCALVCVWSVFVSSFELGGSNADVYALNQCPFPYFWGNPYFSLFVSGTFAPISTLMLALPLQWKRTLASSSGKPFSHWFTGDSEQSALALKDFQILQNLTFPSSSPPFHHFPPTSLLPPIFSYTYKLLSLPFSSFQSLKS